MKDSKLTPDEFRVKLKKEGKLPPRSFQERPINISNTGAIFEAFVPPEGDGRASIVSKEGVKLKYTELEKKGKSLLELRKVRKYEDKFNTKEFAQVALDLVIEAQQHLSDLKKNQEKLHELVTEKAFPEMVHGLDTKTVRWQFVQSLEPPRVVHVRTTEMLSKDNLYAQVTVRLHTQQILAIYDRFGRLMYGDPEQPRDVLEYVVFEKHIANEYGQWRIHGKIIPDWMPNRDVLHKTQPRETTAALPVSTKVNFLGCWVSPTTKMPFTNEDYLPTNEELTVPELELTSSVLRAGAHHFGKYCDKQCKEFMLCVKEDPDPRKCLSEGKEVTRCGFEFFGKVKQNCFSEFTKYFECIDHSDRQMSLSKCRATQASFDKCIKDTLGQDRPHLGYFSSPRLHHTERPKPQVTPQKLPDPIPGPPDFNSSVQPEHKFSPKPV